MKGRAGPGLVVQTQDGHQHNEVRDPDVWFHPRTASTTFFSALG